MFIEIIVSLAVIVGIFVLSIPVVILDGWVLTKLWAWFMIPAFGFAPLPIAVALGISLIVSYVTMRVQPDPPMTDDEKKAYHKTKFIGQFARPFLALLLGWIVSCYVPKDMKPLNQTAATEQHVVVLREAVEGK